ncbi:MAG: fumarylacetoacetate hydrolase family protein [Candidatus Hydrothermarchaeota archaeon]
MKVIRFKRGDKIKNGILLEEKVLETDLEIFDLLKGKEYQIINEFDVSSVKILPPVYPEKIICVGLNYKDHAEELGLEIPEEPILFLKPPSSIIGHRDSIIYPRQSNRVDYEVELAIVIGKTCKDVRRKHAEDVIAGYTILNDVTARDLQRKDGQWTRSKSFDTFCPIGPCIENELNPENLKIRLRLNNEIKQDSTTKNLIFDCYSLIEFVSGIMTLRPGDIISTGTPAGVGPLKRKDIVECEIEGIGSIWNDVS